MSEPVDWKREAEIIKGQLLAIERAAAQAVIPPGAMAEIKSAVDHCRTTLWAAATTSSKDQFARQADILAARLMRIEEMCERLVGEIAAGRVWAGTPGLGRFVAGLDETERAVSRLLEDSASANQE